MSINRRNFLRLGLLSAGAATAAAAGAAGIKALAGAVGDAGKADAAAEQTTAKAACPACAARTETAGAEAAESAHHSGALMPAMTPDGKVIHVCNGKVVVRHPLKVLQGSDARKGVPGRKWVMVIDLAKCDGCKECTKACQASHHAPADREWIKVFQMQDGPNEAPYWMPKPCFHCDNPPCTRVCPVDATFKRQDGVVLIDNERCIGCRFCMAACPYSTRYFNWGRPQDPPEAQKEPYSPEHGYPRRVGTVEKCDFCPELAEAGKLPCCSSACAMGAIYFGDQAEDAVTNSQGDTQRLTKLLEERAGYRYMEELGTEPRVYYLPPKNRMYPAPLRRQHHA